MGSWGYEPFENDGAQDWASTLTASKALAKDIKKALTKRMRRDPEEIRAASEMILNGIDSNILFYEYALELIPIAKEKLEKLLEDEKWIDSWEKPAVIRRCIRKQIKKLEALEESL